MLVHRRSDVLELPRVELGALLAEDLAQEQAADEVANGEPVGPGDLVEIVRRDEAARPRHVLDDDRRVARDVLAHVPRDRPRVSVEAAARREADHDAHGLALVEGLLGRCRPDHSAEHSDDPEDDDHYLLSYAPLHPSLSLIRRCVSSSWSGRHYTAIIQCGPHSHAGSRSLPLDSVYIRTYYRAWSSNGMRRKPFRTGASTECGSPTRSQCLAMP